ncbi:MAG: hypothetical protein ACLSHU_02335 [Oscillospiraceae bacterium]
MRHIAIGNGTASRETEALTADLIRQMPEVSYMIVNEAGASVYSASPWQRRNSRNTTSTFAPLCPLPGGFRTPWRSW